MKITITTEELAGITRLKVIYIEMGRVQIPVNKRDLINRLLLSKCEKIEITENSDTVIIHNLY